MANDIVDLRHYRRVGCKRGSTLKKRDRTSVSINKDLLPFLNAYANQKYLYIEEAATELITIGLSQVYGWEARALPKPSRISLAMHKLWDKKGVEAGIALRKPANTPDVRAKTGSRDAFQKPSR